MFIINSTCVDTILPVPVHYAEHGTFYSLLIILTLNKLSESKFMKKTYKILKS